ncbi:MAG TPA: hypothetical protein VF786_02510 [Terriglobales bacterium]
MRKEERERFAEEWLDAALKNCDAEPRLGLESRIMASLRSQQNASRWSFARLWQPVAVAALVAVLALGVVFWQRGRHQNVAKSVPANGRIGSISPAQTYPREATNSGVAQAAAAPPQRRRARRHAGGAHSRRDLQEPRQEQFPASVPLSSDEQRLLAYVRETPKAEVALAAQVQEEWQKSAELEAHNIYLEGRK